MTSPRIATRIFILSCFALLLLASVAFTQDAAPAGTSDPRLAVIPNRTVAEIDNDIDNAQANLSLAKTRRDQMENRLKEINSTLEDYKRSEKDANNKLSNAKKAKRESEVIAANAEKRAFKQASDLLNKLKELRKTEVEATKAEAELSTAQINALQLERELVGKRSEYDSLKAANATTLALSTHQHMLTELETRLLKLQEEQANATKKLADRQKDMVTRRKSLHQAQVKLGGSV